MQLKPFQEKAIAKLKDAFLFLWKQGGEQKITFKSPTGSGKTVMLAQFLRDITNDPRFANMNIGFIWITNSDDLAMQSKNKLNAYYTQNEIPLLTVADLGEKLLPKNGIFFVNWQKLVQNRANMRPLKARTESESGTTFDEYMENTHKYENAVVLIIDEEHIAADTVLANDLVKGIIKPRITIGVSATPQEKGVLVEVNREEVIEAGLIKEKIAFQTEEDLAKAANKNQDEILLDLAVEKRKELHDYFKSLDLEINPLVLIQLPNDDKATAETSNSTKLDFVKMYLTAAKKSNANEIAVWLSGDKKENLDLEEIHKNNSNISFLIFKQAAATGWDCPRASILVMFREIKNPTFAIQTIGRILRMPLAEHFPKPELNKGYLYTNYKRNEVLAETNKSNFTDGSVWRSFRKKDIAPIKLESVFMSRSDYNDLGATFEDTFCEAANKFFGITNDILDKGQEKLAAKGLDTLPQLSNNLIAGVEIENYDDFINEIKQGTDVAKEMSQQDIEKLYNLLCFKIIAEQTDESRKFAPERSWADLKTALNVWFKPFFNDRPSYYKVIVKDLLKIGNGNSILFGVIGDALERYRPIRDAEVTKKETRKKKTIEIEIPPREMDFTDSYEPLDYVQKCAMQPFYLRKNYLGKENETKHINYLENNKDVVWWHKNGDHGSEFFAISYFNSSAQKEQAFYPDWIYKTSDGKICIEDTKSGFTATSQETKDKEKALKEWLAEQNKKGGLVFEGRIC